MSTRPITRRDDSQIHQFRQLYGDARAASVIAKIDGLVTKYRNAVGAEIGNAAGLSEKDVLLITYGDTLTDNEVAPLKVLKRFHAEFLQGIFDLIHILPFHPYSSDDGFSVTDYKAVREDLGSWADVENLSQECRVMADAVINHISSQSTWFKEYLSGDPEFADFFIDYDPGEDLSAVVRPRTSPLLTHYDDAMGQERHIWTTFSADQVDLNFRNPNVLIAVIDVLFFLISKGARLLRLDAVTFLWKKPGTSCANLPETHALIKVMRHAISALRSDVTVITETNVPHRENIAYFGDGHDEAHMVYNFALPPLLAYSFIEGDGHRLSVWASQLSTPSNEVCFLNFSASHDGIGVRPVEEILTDSELQQLVDAALGAKGMVSSRTLSDGKEHPYELNCTFLDLISRDDDDTSMTVARFVASQAIVLAMPGVPAIYIQSLLGTRNDLQGVSRTGRARSINRSQHDYSQVADSLADEQSLEGRVFSAIKHLIEVRREHAEFSPYAPFRVFELGHQVFAIQRGDASSGAIISCIVNLTKQSTVIDIKADVAGTDLLTDSRVAPGSHTLPAYAIRWVQPQQQL